jgi:hypothetical protein
MQLIESKQVHTLQVMGANWEAEGEKGLAMGRIFPESNEMNLLFFYLIRGYP